MTSSDDLEARKTTLEDRVDSLGSQMIVFTWLVVVGLFIEFYAVLGLDATHDWNTLIDRIGLSLVTIGVAGELNVEYRARKEERRLRSVNADIDREAKADLKVKDERIAELNLKAKEQDRERIKLEIELKQKILEAEYRARTGAIKEADERRKRLPGIIRS
jgi:hypothetical protein